MTQKLLNLLFPAKIAYAHCDIPCGIYDPHNAQMAAHTVIRMTNLIIEANEEDKKKLIHNISRYTKIKEEHAEIVKHEIRVLWGDYFKEEHIKKYPHIKEAIFHTLKLASKARQEVDIDAVNDLLAHVLEISEFFWKTKDKQPIRVPAPYPTGGEMVTYK